MPKTFENITNIVLEAADKARKEIDADKISSYVSAPVEWPVECTVGPGLEGAIACETKIGYVSGKQGNLVYRGYNIFDLCAHSTYEEVAYLLLHGNLPNAERLSEFKSKLAEFRYLPKTLRLLMGFPLEDMNAMAALRMGTNLMRQHQTERDLMQAKVDRTKVISSDDDSVDTHEKVRGEQRAVYEFRDPKANRPARRKAKRDLQQAKGVESCYHLIAGVSTLTAAIARIQRGSLPIEPDPELGHAANLLYMMTGKRPTREAERVMDIALILHADHGMNASTFAAMVVASTLSDIYFSIGSGIAALNGPLHGGANEEVLKTLREIADPKRVDGWYASARKNRRKIMGFGHRVYKAYDPRARVLAPLADYLVNKSGDAEAKNLLKIASGLETRVVADLGASKGIFPNVDFYSGLVYSSMGIPSEMFTPIFAVSRVAGWTARVLEYMKSNRIFRPRATYVGEISRGFTPLADR